MSAFPANSEKLAHLIQQMTKLGVDEADIEETFTNHGYKTTRPTGVMLLHRPSGLSAKCQATANQEQNRFLARQLLVEKIARNQKNYGSGRSVNFMYLVLAFMLMAFALILL